MLTIGLRILFLNRLDVIFAKVWQELQIKPNERWINVTLTTYLHNETCGDGQDDN